MGCCSSSQELPSVLSLKVINECAKGKYVYCLESLRGLKHVKIGRTNNPARRYKEYQTALGNAFGFTALFKITNKDDSDAEADLHSYFKENRKELEFFDFTSQPDYVNTIKKVLKDKKYTYECILP